METITTFMRAFIAADHAARRAVYCAPSEEEFDEKVRALDAFLDEGQGAMEFPYAWDFVDPSDQSDGAATGRRMLAATRPRTLFLIRHYDHREFGALARCYVDSGMAWPGTRYMESLFVAATTEGPRIVAVWRVCVTCRGSGRLGDDACSTCGGTGWEPAGGATLGELGRITEVERFEAPTDPTSRADYEKD